LNKLKILVLCGGQSAEHSVSLVSARTVLANLDRRRYEPFLVHIDRQGTWRRVRPELLSDRVAAGEKRLVADSKVVSPSEALARMEAVFPALHGPMGEDGTIQGLLEVAGIPYVGCGVLGSALGMDKEISKHLCVHAGLPILPYAVVRRPEEGRQALKRLGLPIFVKPARLGSSVGISKVERAHDLAPAIREALRFDDKVVLEKGIIAREIETAVLGDPDAPSDDPLALRASICGEIAPKATFYTYAAKYLDPDGAQLLIPAPIPESTAGTVRELALKAFRTLDGYGMARADFLLDKRTGKIWFNEVNTIPGFTAISMYPQLWRESGLKTPELIDRLVRLALRRRRARVRLQTAP
jgi:D-alanine-D-alanine ligase